MIGDLLKDINTDINKAIENKNNQYLRNALEAAFIPEKKFILPEGTPPYKEQQGPSAQLTGGFWMIAKKLYVYTRADLKPAKRESMFIQDLEILSKEEAAIFVTIKDQTLSTLFPNITRESLTKVGYFAVQ